MPSSKLQLSRAVQTNQKSYVGGVPYLPRGSTIPDCKLCGQELTFFFQIELSDLSLEGEMIFSVFACTSCADENELIPEMITQRGERKPITRQFLHDYQTNFRLMMFRAEDAIKCEDYNEKIAFKEIKFQRSWGGLGSFGKLGGKPVWIEDDEHPSPLEGAIEFVFGLQIAQDFRFDIVEGAPPQMSIDIMGSPSLSKDRYYYLFNENALYFFFSSMEPYEVFVTTQVY